MKRPGGFDRLPEPEEDQTGQGGVSQDGFGPRKSEAPPADDTLNEPVGDDEARDGRLSAVQRATQSLESASALSGDRGAVESAANGPASETGFVERIRARRDDSVRAAARQLRRAERQVKRRSRWERRRFSADARRKRRSWWIALSAVAALAVFVAVGAFTPVMAVTKISVEGAEALDPNEVAEALSDLEGVPLALVDTDEVRDALQSFSRIQRYAIELRPPHTLVVRIQERVPVISVKSGGRYEQYDAAGVLVASGKKRAAGVPLAVGRVRDTGGEQFAAAASALRNMPEDLRGQISEVRASSAQSIVFTLDSGVTVTWGDAEESQRKAVVLDRMLGALQDRELEEINVSSVEAPVFR